MMLVNARRFPSIAAGVLGLCFFSCAWADSSCAAVDPSTGRLLVSDAPCEVRPPASTAKLATALVVLDRLELAREVRVSRRAANQPPSKVGLRSGERWSVRDLLYALLLESGNDAASALAQAAAGDENLFARWMTQKARELGCQRTRFGNASGLPHPDNRTCALDLAALAGAAFRDPTLRKILSTKNTTIRNTAGRQIALANHNRLLGDDRFDVVGKTGYTRKARKCFAGVLKTQDGPVLVAILGSDRLWPDLRGLAQRAERVAGRRSSIVAPAPAEGDADDGFAVCRILSQLGLDLDARRLAALVDPASRDAARGLRVRDLQRFLTEARYAPGPVDGKFGPRTRGALRRFLTDQGLLLR